VVPCAQRHGRQCTRSGKKNPQWLEPEPEGAPCLYVREPAPQQRKHTSWGRSSMKTWKWYRCTVTVMHQFGVGPRLVGENGRAKVMKRSHSVERNQTTTWMSKEGRSHFRPSVGGQAGGRTPRSLLCSGKRQEARIRILPRGSQDAVRSIEVTGVKHSRRKNVLQRQKEISS